MTVSAIIVTRGDVDLVPILESLPGGWEVLLWINNGVLWRWAPDTMRHSSYGQHLGHQPDLAVYGRYAAIPYAFHDLIYVQDDDCIVSDPAALAEAWRVSSSARCDCVVANMPQEFRPHYPDSCLVGFGACFQRELPKDAFDKMLIHESVTNWTSLERTLDSGEKIGAWDGPLFRRTADVVFTTLTRRLLVDVPVEVLPYAYDEKRMWKQPNHYGERTQVLEMARKVRDA